MNLRDQLLKAGLASKKQARKAANDSRLEKKKNTGAEEQIAQDIAAKKAKQQENEKKLNRLREKERQAMENVFRARQIILQNDLLVSGKREETFTYYFIIEQTKIRSVKVNAIQQGQLEYGSLGIVVLDFDANYYYLLLEIHCRRLQEINPQHVVCLHPKLTSQSVKADPSS